MHIAFDDAVKEFVEAVEGAAQTNSIRNEDISNESGFNVAW